MKTNIKEIRDPIHNFIHADRDEIMLINSSPFQRLRNIHQLSMTYMVYPGATHKRFEHSLGVMELAGRAFDAITAVDNVDEQTRGLFPEITSVQFIVYWRKVLRLAALCHDLGHAPFSHAAEIELFPLGFDHEVITRNILQCEELAHLFLKMVPRVIAKDVVKLALGRKKVKDLSFTDWETLLAEIITGDSLGVDRMDYLLRDAYHTGVGYGKFDHFRLLETIRIVPPPPTPAKIENQKEFDLDGLEVPEASTEPMLGLLIGGIHASEALLLARYFMYAQVYFHPVRVAYDHHLKSFLRAWLPGGKFSTDVKEHLGMTDNEISTAIRVSAENSSAAGHNDAARIVTRNHFKRLIDFTPDQLNRSPLLPAEIKIALEQQFGSESFIFYNYEEKKKPQQFSVRLKDGKSASSLGFSPILSRYPTLTLNFILVNDIVRNHAREFLHSQFKDVL